jgi:hypothetical protein
VVQQIGRECLDRLADDEQPVQQGIEGHLLLVVIPGRGCSLQGIDRPLRSNR